MENTTFLSHCRNLTGKRSRPEKKPFHLDFCYANMEEEDLDRLQNNQFIQALGLDDISIVGTHLKSLTMIPHLRALQISSCANIKDAALATLSECPELEYLDLHSSNITAKGLTVLSAIKSLKHLNLSNCKKIKNDAMSALSEFPNLLSLDMTFTGINDEGMPGLSMLPNLEHLDLYACSSLTEAGILKLCKMTSLRNLVLGCDMPFGKSISNKVVKELKKSLPGCVIENIRF